MHYMAVYILRCADGVYYTGVTNDLDRRLEEHQSGLNPTAYTFKRRPVKLVFYEWFPDAEQAIAFEKQVKGWRRQKKEALIRRDWGALPELSKSYAFLLKAKQGQSRNSKDPSTNSG
jgi:putative endonuclease